MTDRKTLLEIASLFILQNSNDFVEFYASFKGGDMKACNEAESLYCEYRDIADNSNL
jgi:hypothetical protein